MQLDTGPIPGDLGNLSEWTFKDIDDVFDNPKTYEQLDSIAGKLISKAEAAGDTEVAGFLDRAAEKLRTKFTSPLSTVWRDGTDPSTDAMALRGWPPRRQAPNAAVTNRLGNTGLLPEAAQVPRATQIRGKLDIPTEAQVEYAQGDMNPILQTAYPRTILLDSTFRQNSLPYRPGDVYGPSSSTKYHATLTEPLRNTTKLKLQSVSIPRIWDNFSCALGNTIIGVGELSNEGAINELSLHWYSLPDHYYKDFSSAPILELFPGTGTHPTLVMTTTADGHVILTFETPTADTVLIVYSDSMHTCKDATGKCYASTSMNRNLGASLGFLPQDDGDIISGIDGTTYLVLHQDSSAPGQWTAKSPPDFIGIKYFTVVLDDYNSNRVNTAVVSIAEAATKIVPSVRSSLQCVQVEEHGVTKREPFYTITNPSTQTIKQNFAENQKLLSLGVPDIGTVSPNLGNVLCICPVSTGQQGQIMTLTGTNVNSTERIYFGPVSLEKVKVMLLDDAGRVVDLKGHNWSMTLVANQLYQF